MANNTPKRGVYHLGEDSIKIDFGEQGNDFQLANLLSVVNDVAGFFEVERGVDVAEIVATMRFYCNHVMGVEEKRRY